MTSDATEIGERLSVEELVAVYVQAEADIRASFAGVAGALGRLDQALSGDDFGFHLARRHGDLVHLNWECPDEVLINLRRSVWHRLIERTQIRKAMSIAAWKQLQKQVDDEDPPEITVENVKSLVDQFREDMPAMLEAAVHEVFDFLRPHNDLYKTNSQFEIGERVVLRYYVSRTYGKTWSVDYDREQNLQALENVFALLDGKIADKTEGYHSRLSTAIKAIPVGQPCHGATDLFEFRGYGGTKTLHLKFRRIDLVKRLNAVAGGMRLKPPEGVAHAG